MNLSAAASDYKLNMINSLDLPEPYLVWFKQKGFPRGNLLRKSKVWIPRKSSW
ncbi:putative quorum-sensing-regulated virulence factor [Prolixibacter sp. SD074]|uniref:putative quorum-sensing-regulated virulence factor n=1 Tax=Prolixibacter sp. SD074 TaxID=2652391 RepID=UPI0012993BCC